MQKLNHKDLPELRVLEEIVAWMDNKFRIPGTRFRFGLDPLLGLAPGVGDVISMVIMGMLVLAMARYGVSGKVLVLMAGNVFLDSTIGAFPVVGDLFDAYYKANQRNLRLLQEHLIEGRHQGSGAGIVVGVLVVGVLFDGIDVICDMEDWSVFVEVGILVVPQLPFYPWKTYDIIIKMGPDYQPISNEKS